jgi:GH25 family lysozyme M1 (1,4-beta-N-acetylmuramidase)
MKIVPKVVDIYHDDTVKDFAKARAFGIRGVIHKATEGGAIADPAYSERRKMAVAAGLLWGAYHFIRPGNVKHQAMRFMDVATPDAQTLMALDHEDPDVSLAAARQFIEAVEPQLNRKLVLYSGFLLKEQIVKATADDVAFFAGRRLWLCQYTSPGETPIWPKQWIKPWLWQFTGDGDGPPPHAVPGLQDKMDINSFDGTDDELAAGWAGQQLSAAATA